MSEKWRILIVDDEPDVRLIIRTTLESRYEVVEAHDGLDALEKVERFEPDFVLMDVMMPLMNGFDACVALRKNPRFSNIPVMFLSALGNKDDIRKGFSSGANFYLTKPFDPPRLMKNVDIFFEKTPPSRCPRRHSIDILHHAEKTGKEPLAPGSAVFEMPRISGEGPKPSAFDAPTVSLGQGSLLMPRVMVVDDTPEIHDLIRQTLDGLYEVVRADDGMQAIELLVKYQPDLLIIDVMIPKMNGFQLVQSLRANRAFQRIPIMMCSAKGADRDINLAKRIGANDYLVKPFSPLDLIAKMKELLAVPGFRVRPKTFTIFQIRDMDGPAKNHNVFEGEEDAREKGQSVMAINKFLAKESTKEGTTRPDATGDDETKKRKRRFFGLGGG